jgi:hypothetical protein
MLSQFSHILLSRPRVGDSIKLVKSRNQNHSSHMWQVVDPGHRARRATYVRMRDRALICAQAPMSQNLLEEHNRTIRTRKKETRREMRDNTQIPRTHGMTAEKEQSRNAGDSQMFGKSKKEGYCEPKRKQDDYRPERGTYLSFRLRPKQSKMDDLGDWPGWRPSFQTAGPRDMRTTALSRYAPNSIALYQAELSTTSHRKRTRRPVCSN